MNRYELNVSLAGKHYCRVVIPDNLTRNEVVKRAKDIAFVMNYGQMPNDTPFKFNLTAWSEEGTPLNMD